MLAAVYHGPDDLRLEQRPVPEIAPDEALVSVISAGICGTDLRIWHGGHRKYPPGTIRIPGHEVVGELVEVGSVGLPQTAWRSLPSASGLTIGQKVFVAPNWGCGQCWQCTRGENNRCVDSQAIGITVDGAFAQYLRVPAAAIQQGCLIPIAGELSAGRLAAAALIEPLACVLRGQNAVNLRPGERVLVMGAGPIGLMHVLLARWRGAGRVLVSEPAAARLAQARQFGADRVFDPLHDDLAAGILEETDGQGMDVIIVAAPSAQAQESAINLASIGGRINFFGGLPKERPWIQLDANWVHYKELIVTGTTACSTRDCQQAAALIDSPAGQPLGGLDLSPLVSHRFPLTDILAAFRMAESGQALKVLAVNCTAR